MESINGSTYAQKSFPVNPRKKLNELSSETGFKIDSFDFASYMDSIDQCAGFREKFEFPQRKTLGTTQNYDDNKEDECIYLCGNSLGLKPKLADSYMKEQMEKWGRMGANTHFYGPMAAATCDQVGKPYMAELVGAREYEVSLMNSLTVNLHLMMQAFYRPTEQRYKILIENIAFPSDRYAVRSCIQMHEVAAKKADALTIITPRDGEHTIRTEDILTIIRKEGNELAVVLLPGVQYLTGQAFDIEAITVAGHQVGAKVGWDLAHAVGNVELRLHEWKVDFAVWCTYKYLNSGAGGIGGAFLHDLYADCPPPHLLGWWSNKNSTRFAMLDEIDLAHGCDSFRVANPPPWLACLNYAGLEIFHEAGMSRVLHKQVLLTGYLEYLLHLYFKKTSETNENEMTAEVITPSDPSQRGSQLSVSFSSNLGQIHEKIKQLGVVCDVRSNIMRLAPAPLYNSFKDVWRFIQLFRKVVETLVMTRKPAPQNGIHFSNSASQDKNGFVCTENLIINKSNHC